jgi:hypothetical protein
VSESSGRRVGRKLADERKLELPRARRGGGCSRGCSHAWLLRVAVRVRGSVRVAAWLVRAWRPCACLDCADIDDALLRVQSQPRESIARNVEGHEEEGLLGLMGGHEQSGSEGGVRWEGRGESRGRREGRMAHLEGGLEDGFGFGFGFG